MYPDSDDIEKYEMRNYIDNPFGEEQPPLMLTCPRCGLTSRCINNYGFDGEVVREFRCDKGHLCHIKYVPKEGK